MSGPAVTGLATNEHDARRRFEATRHRDPFPKVAPSLLNSADLLDYIAATGMIFPFTPSPNLVKTLKPASCAIPFAGRVISWNPRAPDPDRTVEPNRFDEVLTRGQILKLPRNSIVYITLEPYFRMPDYIAGRFNLTIRDVYRGLLVGTGPLVDPGFEGLLSVPIHNLTSNDYEVVTGDPLVWMEFTKITPHRNWDPGTRKSRNPYVAFPRFKGQRDLDDYLQSASSEPIMSSIPEQVGAARIAAEDAKEAAKDAERTVRSLQRVSVWGGVAAAAALLVAIAALVLPVMSAVRDEGKDRSALERRVTTLNEMIAKQQSALQSVRRQVGRWDARQP